MEEIDLFIFGTPREQSPEFCGHQLELQQRFGWELISPINFTFQHLRMFGDDKSDLQARLHLLYSDIMADRLSQIGSMRGLGPLLQEHAPVIKLMLPARWISDQITALENVDEYIHIEQMGFHRNLELIRVPDPLFNIEKVLIAQSGQDGLSQDGFTTLNEFSLAA